MSDDLTNEQRIEALHQLVEAERARADRLAEALALADKIITDLEPHYEPPERGGDPREWLYESWAVVTGCLAEHRKARGENNGQ